MADMSCDLLHISTPCIIGWALGQKHFALLPVELDHQVGQLGSLWVGTCHCVYPVALSAELLVLGPSSALDFELFGNLLLYVGYTRALQQPPALRGLRPGLLRGLLP